MSMFSKKETVSLQSNQTSKCQPIITIIPKKKFTCVQVFKFSSLLIDWQAASALVEMSHRKIPHHATRKLGLDLNQVTIMLESIPLLQLLSVLHQNSPLQRIASQIHTRRMHKLLHFYTPNAIAFRMFMREHGCIISGSSVSWLIDGFPLTWHPQQMSVYTPRGIAAISVLYLQSLGYTLSSTTQGGYILERCCLLSVTKLSNAQGIQVHIMESENPNPVTPVMNFNNTLTMNYLEPDFLVLLHPTITLLRIGVIRSVLDRPGDKWASQLRQGGYTICQQVDSVPRWVLRMNPQLHLQLGGRKGLIIPITNNALLYPINNYPPPGPRSHQFVIDPSYHQFCARSSCSLPEVQRLALAALHSPHILI
jgi:hypothetical protein